MLKSRFVFMLTAMLLIGMMIVGCSDGSEQTGEQVNETGGESAANESSESEVEPPEDVHLQFLTGKVETVDLIDELIAEFEAEYPHITVEQEYAREASNVIQVKFASGDVPDITTVVEQDYIDQGKYIDLSEEAYWSRILPSIKDLNTDIRSGNTYSFATNVTMAGLFYNKQLFEELGLEEAHTWDHFVSNLEAIKEQRPDIVPLFLPGREAWSLGHLVEFMAHGVIKQEYGIPGSRSAFINNEVDKLAYGEEDGPMAIFAERILELQSKGLINVDAVTASYDNQKEAFATGNAAMISQGMWVMGDLLDINPDMADNIGFSPYPAIAEGSQPVVLSAEDSKYAITSASEHPEEAKLFLEFLARAENVKVYSEEIKSPPSFIDVDADWGPLSEQTAVALENAANIQFTEWPSGFAGDDNGRMIQELLTGKYATPIEFATEYAQSWNRAWEATN